jgi:GDP-L-fucose synthase
MCRFIKAESVVHLAANCGGIGKNKRVPGELAYDNLMMGMNVLEGCRLAEVDKLLVVGTICAYPKFTPVPFKEKDLWNGYPEETNAPYGVAKKALMTTGQAYAQQYGMNVVHLLIVNMYGPHDHFDLEDSHVIPAMMRKFHEATEKGDSSVELWGDGSPTREFLYVDDAAEAIRVALEKYDSPEPMNIGSGMEISMKDLATKVASLTGFKGDIIWDTSKPNGQPRRCLDVSKAKEEIDWVAKTPFDVGLSKTYEWYKGAQV